MAHPLDRPIWTALTTRQAHLALGDASARCFDPAISPMAATAENNPESLRALGELIPAGGDITLLEPNPPSPPEGVRAEIAGLCVQLIARAFAPRASDLPIEPLGDADAEEMLALALLTRPGPFRARTHKMGRYIGIRENGRLAAMCGERLAAPGFVEISALCTHPDFRGRGYGAALLQAVGARILQDGDAPFLHAYADNPAVAMYRALGFEVRHELTHAIWRR